MKALYAGPWWVVKWHLRQWNLVAKLNIYTKKKTNRFTRKVHWMKIQCQWTRSLQYRQNSSAEGELVISERYVLPFMCSVLYCKVYFLTMNVTYECNLWFQTSKVPIYLGVQYCRHYYTICMWRRYVIKNEESRCYGSVVRGDCNHAAWELGRGQHSFVVQQLKNKWHGLEAHTYV